MQKDAELNSMPTSISLLLRYIKLINNLVCNFHNLKNIYIHKSHKNIQTLFIILK